MPNNPEMTLFWKHFSAALGDINADERSPKEAFDNAAAAIRGALPAVTKAPLKGGRKS
jgi:maltose/maltodextrin transport system substrate-binding protein